MSADPHSTGLDASTHLLGAPRPKARLPASAAYIGGTALVLFAVFWVIDFYTSDRGSQRQGPFELLLDLDMTTLQNALGGVAQVIVAVLGIAITVVSIVVQLASTRYTPRIADMFFRDKTNLTMMGFFVVACIDAVWVSLAVGGKHVPRATVIFTGLMVTGSLLLLVPYFAYVFDFLDPEKVILRLAYQVLEGTTGRGKRDDLVVRQAETAAGIEHLADVAVNAVAQKDKVIASHAVAALRAVLGKYLESKRRLPPAWFEIGERIRKNPEFIALAPDSLAEIQRQKVWLEWKTLRHFRSTFAESLIHLPEMSHVMAIETRYVGESALAAGDRPVIDVVIKFFNTYVRTALNAKDVRACYNILHQYRQLAERLLAERFDDLALEIGRHFVYYGQTALAMNLGFVTETSAYDLGTLCEHAFSRKVPCHDSLLRLFLQVDQETEQENGTQEQTLRGIRKAQLKLATFYLLQDAKPHARLIFEDMRRERPERMNSIRAELMAISTKEFWEVTDRGINFDYLDEAQRRKLDEFFGWFG